jgi:copper transporter 1
MSDCEKCQLNQKGYLTNKIPDCDLLTVYSSLCYSMPTMPECNSYNSLCPYIPNFPICNPTSGNNSVLPPQMKMFFHFGVVDYVLFETWIPRTSLEYAGTFLAVVLMTVFLDALRFLKFFLETKWTPEPTPHTDKRTKGQDEAPLLMKEEEAATDDTIKTEKKACCKHGGEATAKNNNKSLRTSIIRSLIRAVLQSIEVGWGLIIMLIAMTYNVGLFFAVMLGAFIGSLIFAPFIPARANQLCH